MFTKSRLVSHLNVVLTSVTPFKRLTTNDRRIVYQTLAEGQSTVDGKQTKMWIEISTVPFVNGAALTATQSINIFSASISHPFRGYVSLISLPEDKRLEAKQREQKIHRDARKWNQSSAVCPLFCRIFRILEFLWRL